MRCCLVNSAISESLVLARRHSSVPVTSGDLPDPFESHIIDRTINIMPRDSAPTRSAILASALQTLRGDGLDGFSIAPVAEGAAVPKGLVLYHFRSPQQLLPSCGKAVAQQRWRPLAGAQAALAGGL